MSEAQPSGLQILALAKMVALASRFFNGLAAHPAFQDSGLDAAEWVALSLVSQSETTAEQLVMTMRISPQRAAAIVAGLAEAGAIAPKEGSPDVMLITNLGIERLVTVNARLELLLRAMPGDPDHSIRTVTRHLARLSRALGRAGDEPAPTEGP